MDKQPSQKQIEANKRNALKSTGPKSAEGKARSRGNGLKHGMAALVVVPPEDQASYEAAMARWEREAGPGNVVEEHLIRRAAVGSVQLDRMEEARQKARESAAPMRSITGNAQSGPEPVARPRTCQRTPVMSCSTSRPALLAANGSSVSGNRSTPCSGSASFGISER